MTRKRLDQLPKAFFGKISRGEWAIIIIFMKK